MSRPFKSFLKDSLLIEASEKWSSFHLTKKNKICNQRKKEEGGQHEK